VAGASEAGPYTWGISASEKWSVGISTYRGVDTAAPINADAAQTNASSASAVAPTITTTAANTMLLGIFASRNGSPTASPPAGMTERNDIASAAGGTAEAGLETCDVAFAGPGATGTKTATLTAATINIGHLIALKPGTTTANWSYSTTAALSASRSLVTSGDSMTVTMTLTATTLTGAPPFPISVTPGALYITGTGGATAAFGAASSSPLSLSSGVAQQVTYTSTALTPGANAGGVLTFKATPADGNGTWAQGTANTTLITPSLQFTVNVPSPHPGINEVVNTGYLYNNNGGTLLAQSPPTRTGLDASIGDYVWYDDNGDGLQAGESGIPGVRVYVDSNANGEYDVGEPFATTDAVGAYRIYGLAAGTYTVRYDSSTLPAGYQPTTAASITYTLSANEQYDGADFGLWPTPVGTGSIGNRLWLDADNDGVQDEDEDGLSGLSVVLEQLIDGVWTTAATQTTGTNGLYAFAALSDGDYRVSVATNSLVASPYGGNYSLGAAMAPTYDLNGTNTPHQATVTLNETQRVYDTLDFGYNWSGSIGDYVWWDADADGVQDNDEDPVSNAFVMVYFDINGNGILDPTMGDYQIAFAITDANGQYLIEHLPPGPYLIDVYEDSITSGGVRDVVPTTRDAVYHELGAGEAFLGADFGYYQGARVEGNVFWDDNRNAYFEGTEQGLTNVTITLTGTDMFGNPVTRVATTDADGHFVFLVPEGNYTVAYSNATLLAGYPTLGDATTPASYTFHAYPGEDGNRTFYDFGVDNSGRIGDTVFADVNGTPGQQTGEAGLAGVTVRLYANPDNSAALNGDETLLEVAVTDDLGQYLFVGLADSAYLVEVATETLPADYATTPTTDPTGAADSQGAATITGGSSVLTLDFGYPLTPTSYSVSGTIYDDNGAGGGTVANGTQDGTEPGLEGLRVVIEVGTNNVYQSYVVFTDASGDYELLGIPEGSDVRITVDTGTLPNTAYVQTGDPNGAPLSGVWTISNLQADATDLDFGYRAQYASISGTVVDGDGDGVAGLGEPPLADVTITLLYAGPDGIFGTDDDATTGTTTGLDGTYSFTDLVPGNYRVSETDPAGYVSLADADGGNPNIIDVLNLQPGQSVTGRDFEDTEPDRTLGDFVWHDLNGDGVQDPGEPGITNATVRLYSAGGDGILGTADDILEGTEVTDADGAYLFEGLAPGSYLTVVDAATLPAGFAAYPSYDLDGEISPNQAVASLGASAGRLDIDFGYFPPARLYGYTYQDKDLNLTRNSGDGSTSGMVVQVWLDGVQVAATNAAADGFYEFAGLVPGTYEVRFICNTNYLTAIPTNGHAAFGDPERNRAVATASDYAVATYVLTSGHGIGDDAGEPVNAGFKGSGPTSSGIDLRAYQGADGVYVEFIAYDVENDGTVRLAVLGADGSVVWSGVTNVLAGARYICRFVVPGLSVGGTYNFFVRDEVGKGWSVSGVTVTPFAAEMVSLSLTGVTLSFASLPERVYEIQWAAWLGDAWQTVATVEADSDRTSAFVTYPDPKAPSGFFRVRVK